MPGYLIVRFSSLGDIVLATSAARLLKRRSPGSRVAMAVKAGFAPALAVQPDLDEVWPLQPGGLGDLIRRARQARLDAVIDLHSSLRSRALGALSGARVVRWRSEGLRRRLRVRAPRFAGPAPAPVYVRFAEAAARALDGSLEGEAPLPRLAVDPAAAAWADDWLRRGGLSPGRRLLAVAPGAAWPTKRWGPGHLAACLDGVLESANVRVLLLGTPGEAPLLDAVESARRVGEPALRADRETGDLRRLAALLARADHFLGHDSGPMHMAAALGLKVSALFGPTVSEFGFFPAGPGHRVFERELACRPCSVHGSRLCPLGHHDCMEGIDPGAVARHLRRVLGQEAGGA